MNNVKNGVNEFVYNMIDKFNAYAVVNKIYFEYSNNNLYLIDLIQFCSLTLHNSIQQIPDVLATDYLLHNDI